MNYIAQIMYVKKKAVLAKNTKDKHEKKKLFLTHTGQLYNQICYDRQTHFMSGIVLYKMLLCFFFSW